MANAVDTISLWNMVMGEHEALPALFVVLWLPRLLLPAVYLCQGGSLWHFVQS